MDHTLTRPDRFTLTLPDGTLRRGADQDWYRDVWQRRAGSGLTVTDSRTTEDFLAQMEAVWPYVTPGTMGLDKPESFVLGCRSFALSRGAVLDGRILPIPRRGKGPRPDLDQVRTFLVWALDKDSPVAFLNYSNGDLKNLDSWH